MKRKRFMLGAVLLVGLFMTIPTVNAASIGVYCWNMQPYVDIVCFNVGSLPNGWAFSMHGTQHAPGGYRDPISGAANPNEYTGQIHMNWVYYDPGSGMDARIGAIISPSTLNGNWIDSFGGSGTFTYVGTGPRSPDVDGEPWNSK